MIPVSGNEKHRFLFIWTPFQDFCSLLTTLQSECALEILFSDSHNKIDLKGIFKCIFASFL